MKILFLVALIAYLGLGLVIWTTFTMLSVFNGFVFRMFHPLRFVGFVLLMPLIFVLPKRLDQSKTIRKMFALLYPPLA